MAIDPAIGSRMHVVASGLEFRKCPSRRATVRFCRWRSVAGRCPGSRPTASSARTRRPPMSPRPGAEFSTPMEWVSPGLDPGALAVNATSGTRSTVMSVS